MLKLIKKLFPSTFKKEVKDHLGVPSLSWSLKNLNKAGYKPKVVYDIGAYEGYWTKDFLDQGFQVYDISQFIRRPYDKALLQIDMLFAKRDSKFITNKRWK